MTGCAWLWLYIGAFLMLAELMLPGFVIFFFGLSAATVGLLRFALGESLTLTWQLAAFSFFAILYLAVLRRLLKKVFAGDREESAADFGHELVGRLGKVTTAIEPPRDGRALVGDAEWTATADAPIAAGADVKVISQNNLTIKVEVL
ncbi:MAG: NfeD family protein [Kiritimatiellae bacterium]|nr:NfeD family protein [Kiritimatiellia bacterium]